MSKVLCTFPGKFGDILWSLATAQHISIACNQPVDFACMPQYLSLVGLLQEQPYIDKAFVINDWLCQHSNYGDQPWNPPAQVAEGYEHCYHLGYRTHPSRVLGGPDIQLIDFIASQHGIKLTSPIPFLYSTEDTDIQKPYVSFSFNMTDHQQKMDFLNTVVRFFQYNRPVEKLSFVDVGSLPWMHALNTIKHSSLFIGCRSSNWVVATGLGKKTLTYETHPERNASGGMGSVFGCTYGNEAAIQLLLVNNLDKAADLAYQIVYDVITKEKQHENVKAITR